MTDRQAWFCPACQKYHAPHCDTCPAPSVAFIDPFAPRPFHPQPSVFPYTILGDQRIGVGAYAVGTALS
jgi:hypothetical protein